MNPYLADLLVEIAEYLEDHQDVVDGSDGPRPNKAMSLLSELQPFLRAEPPAAKKLGFAAAVREYGDNWRQYGFGWNGESYRGLSPATIIALGELGPDHDDACRMRDCTRHGRMFQT